MASSAAPAVPAPPLVDLANHIYIKDHTEGRLYLVWLSLPHLEIEIGTYISELNAGPSGQITFDVSLALQEYVNETNTTEQEKRFALVAQKVDIIICLGKAREFLVMSPRPRRY